VRLFPLCLRWHSCCLDAVSIPCVPGFPNLSHLPGKGRAGERQEAESRVWPGIVLPVIRHQTKASKVGAELLVEREGSTLLSPEGMQAGTTLAGAPR